MVTGPRTVTLPMIDQMYDQRASSISIRVATHAQARRPGPRWLGDDRPLILGWPR